MSTVPRPGDLPAHVDWSARGQTREARYYAAVHSDRVQQGARAAMALADAEIAEVRAEAVRLAGNWRTVTRCLEFGDGITEPQIGCAEFITICEERFAEAAEWRETQRWRDDCHLAGHALDEDCREHDPSLRLLGAEAKVQTLAEDFVREFERADALAAQVKAARALHRPVLAKVDPWCRADGQAWPCPTTLALGGES